MGVSTSRGAGGICSKAPHWRIVSQLKNGLSWPAMLKFATGSTGAVCNNLGVVSLRESAILAVLLLIETIQGGWLSVNF